MKNQKLEIFSDSKNVIYIFFDGQCPFCSNFVGLLNLKKRYNVKLFDLREQSEAVTWFENSGYRVDEGMIVTINNQIYYAEEAVHILSLLSSRSFSGIIYRFFFSKLLIAKVLYPIMKKGRNITLYLMQKKKISEL